MADLADVYASTQRSLSELVNDLPETDLDRSVPATPGWTIRNVVAHLVGDLDCVTRGDFPREFFESFAAPEAVVKLNDWTKEHIDARSGRSIRDLTDEWAALTDEVVPMMRGEVAWPDGILFFADRVLVTDIGVHQHDIYGALGIERDRESPPVKIGVSGYLATVDMRLRSDDGPAVAVEAPGKRWVVGGEDPAATLRSDRFELFRALSGRRSPDQIRAYDWSGDPEPFVPYFYPYGPREEALIE